MDIRLAIAGVLASVVFLVGIGLMSRPAEKPEKFTPDAGFELVQRCKPPFMRAPREYVVKDKQGNIFLIDAQKQKTLISPDVPLKRVCKPL